MARFGSLSYQSKIKRKITGTKRHPVLKKSSKKFDSDTSELNRSLKKPIMCKVRLTTRLKDPTSRNLLKNKIEIENSLKFSQFDILK